MSDIRVENLSYAYPGTTKPVLRNIDLHIPRGEFVLVAGPSGCGKSTLALALAGLIPSRISGPMRGQIFFGDQCITTMDIHQTSQHIGMVFQNPDNQLIHLDVEAEVAFGPENLGLHHDEIARRVEESISYTHMESFSKSPIFALSGGQKQRIAVSATLAMQPEVLVLDEPTSDLDPAGTQEVLAVLRRLNRERQTTIVLIEHKIDEVIPWVDRVLLMDQGQIVKDDTPQRISEDETVWERLGVSIPEVVRLSHRLPDVFSSRNALSVEEAADALRGTAYQKRLRGGRLFDNLEAHLGRPNADALVEWRGTQLTFGGRQVLNDIHFCVHPGEWLALAGPNGSGKTSLASIAMGLQAPSGGHVLCRGTVVKPGQVSKQAARIGYLFQAADNMLFAPKVIDELRFGKKHRRGRLGQDCDIDISEIAKLIDLPSLLEANPFHLSHGQRKRLAIGALLAGNPEMLILDEPTTGQDEGHAKAFLAFLQELRHKWQMTYLMITHDMRAVAQYASRMVVLDRGQIALSGSPAHVFARAEVLASASIVPPPMARLHGLLCDHVVDTVALHVDEFLQRASVAEVLA